MKDTEHYLTAMHEWQTIYNNCSWYQPILMCIAWYNEKYYFSKWEDCNARDGAA